MNLTGTEPGCVNSYNNNNNNNNIIPNKRIHTTPGSRYLVAGGGASPVRMLQ